MKSLAHTSVSAYIAASPVQSKQMLREMRKAIKQVLSNAEETIGYGIPTFKVYGKNIVHVGGYEHHIGFYPGSSAIKHFEKDLQGYKLSKGTVQFPLDKPLPLHLVRKMTIFRLKMMEEKAKKR